MQQNAAEPNLYEIFEEGLRHYYRCYTIKAQLHSNAPYYNCKRTTRCNRLESHAAFPRATPQDSQAPGVAQRGKLRNQKATIGRCRTRSLGKLRHYFLSYDNLHVFQRCFYKDLALRHVAKFSIGLQNTRVLPPSPQETAKKVARRSCLHRAGVAERT